MDISEFVSPLQTVQVISIFTYLNTLNDILYSNKFLAKNDQHKRIPIVNALYDYLLLNERDEYAIQQRKIHLAKALINGSDLYGAQEHEQPDSYFIDTLFQHIINNLVFDKYINVFGFIVETIRGMKDDTIGNLAERMNQELASMKFENEFGNSSMLTQKASKAIYRFLIEPLFPISKRSDGKFTDLDYIYAMAGKMFLKWNESNGTLDKIFNGLAGSDDGGSDEELFQEYVEIAHLVEQLVIADKVDQSALKIFALPALVNYVHRRREKFGSLATVDIVGSEKHWQAAFRDLFTFLDKAFSMTNQDPGYQFSLALSNFKNRSTLAREEIEMNCRSMIDGEIESEITNYKNNPKSYRCKFTTDGKPLEDLNQLFNNSVLDVSEKYQRYEIEYSRKVFGEAFIRLTNTQRIEVTKGLTQNYYSGGFGIIADSVQLVNDKHDLLQFHQPENDTFSYYALVRQGFNISLIKEADDPELFRKTLGLSSNQVFRSNNFPTVLKKVDEPFEALLTRIADTRGKKFLEDLKTRGYDETPREFWENFGLSLLPFYTCIQDIGEGKSEAEFVCPLDAFSLVPLVQEVGILVSKVTQLAGRSALSFAETTLRTLTVRTTIRSFLRITGRSLLNELRFQELIPFGNFGISLLRFIDPGFELAFKIGHRGLRSISSLFRQLESRFTSWRVRHHLRGQLFRAKYAISHPIRNVGRKFKKDVYVNTIYSLDTGYGYKYVPSDFQGELPQIRTIHPSLADLPLIQEVEITNEFLGVDKFEVKKYREMDLDTGRLIGPDYFENQDGVILSESKVFEFSFVEKEHSLLDQPNLIHNNPKSAKQRLQEALDFARGRIPESQVRRELQKYVFPIGGKTERDFISDWKSEIPQWALPNRIEEPEVFQELIHQDRLDVTQLTELEAKARITKIYPRENRLIPILTGIATNDYITREVFKYQRFEDYVALRNYCGTGYKRISGNTPEAERMKNSIYRLAIRQSEDGYVKKLFRGESRLSEIVDELFIPGDEFTFDRFTSVTTELSTAVSFLAGRKYPYRQIVYEMEFFEPYLRAKVDGLSRLDEKESILLPGTGFIIKDVEFEGRGRDFVTVKLKQKPKDIALWQMEVMAEIKSLKESGTVFYAKDSLN